jgi:hypothetical protein
LNAFVNKGQSTRLAPIKGVSELNQPYMRAYKLINPIYSNSTSENYTFTSGSDVRFLSISSLLSSSTAFNSYLSNAFQYYTILGVTLEYLPIVTNNGQVLTTFLAPLIANVNDNIGTPANPSNTLLESIDSVLTHTMAKLTTTSKQFCHPVNILSTFNSVFNNKYGRLSLPSGGQIELGQDGASTFPVAVQTVGILNVWIHVVHEGPIA